MSDTCRKSISFSVPRYSPRLRRPALVHGQPGVVQGRVTWASQVHSSTGYRRSPGYTRPRRSALNPPSGTPAGAPRRCRECGGGSCPPKGVAPHAQLIQIIREQRGDLDFPTRSRRTRHHCPLVGMMGKGFPRSCFSGKRVSAFRRCSSVMQILSPGMSPWGMLRQRRGLPFRVRRPEYRPWYILPFRV